MSHCPRSVLISSGVNGFVPARSVIDPAVALGPLLDVLVLIFRPRDERLKVLNSALDITRQRPGNTAAIIPSTIFGFKCYCLLTCLHHVRSIAP